MCARRATMERFDYPAMNPETVRRAADEGLAEAERLIAQVAQVTGLRDVREHVRAAQRRRSLLCGRPTDAALSSVGCTQMLRCVARRARRAIGPRNGGLASRGGRTWRPPSIPTPRAARVPA